MKAAGRGRGEGDGGGWRTMEGDEMPYLSVILIHRPPGPNDEAPNDESLGASGAAVCHADVSQALH